MIKGSGRLTGPGCLEVGERRCQADAILICTGSDPVIPPLDGLQEAGYWTNREATALGAPRLADREDEGVSQQSPAPGDGGVWAVAPLASEWIHQAGLAIKAEVDLEVLLATVAQFPSYSEAFFSALQQLEL